MLPLWLVPACPLAGYITLAAVGDRLGERSVAAVGTGSVALSAVAAWALAFGFLASPPAGATYDETVWTWLDVAGFQARAAFHLDPLALVMMLVVASVGFLIHLYSVEFMADDAGYARYFAYMNLFVAAMLILVLSGDLLFLFLGWEGVGLCSYLLIGFWYDDPANGAAARKAFIVTRVGDTGFLLGMLLLFNALGTADIQAILAGAAAWPADSTLPTAAAILLLLGALGKSAQLPLQTWLPDAMAGPTPVSALIHAATMVTAGVYLIARLHGLFALAPGALHAIAWIGALTLLLAGCSALVQEDIKRILAYSTISQIGYMFLALGAGAWTAAIFHFMTHAFFKALLFLAAGAVIHSLNGEHDIFRMGGLRRQLPLPFWSFVIGGASLAALPLVTAGFFSKDLILWEAWSGPFGSFPLWVAGWAGSFLTGLYIFRLVFWVFFGPMFTPPTRAFGRSMALPLVILSVLAVVGGYLETPSFLGDLRLLSDFLAPVFGPTTIPMGRQELPLAGLAVIASLGGILAAWWFFLRRRRLAAHLAAVPLCRGLYQWWAAGWGFDLLYDRLLVRPYAALTAHLKGDPADMPYADLTVLAQALHRLLARTENGHLRWYAVGVAAGVILLVGMERWP